MLLVKLIRRKAFIIEDEQFSIRRIELDELMNKENNNSYSRAPCRTSNEGEKLKKKRYELILIAFCQQDKTQIRITVDHQNQRMPIP